MSLQSRLDNVRTEWPAITQRLAPDGERFAAFKREADTIIDAGRWVSGPADLLSVLGRSRIDEVIPDNCQISRG